MTYCKYLCRHTRAKIPILIIISSISTRYSCYLMMVSLKDTPANYSMRSDTRTLSIIHYFAGILGQDFTPIKSLFNEIYSYHLLIKYFFWRVTSRTTRIGSFYNDKSIFQRKLQEDIDRRTV